MATITVGQLGSIYPDGIHIETWQNANEQVKRAAGSHRLRTAAGCDSAFGADQYHLTVRIAGMPAASGNPDAVEGVEQPWCRFNSFVVGINRQREAYRFAPRLQSARANHRK